MAQDLVRPFETIECALEFMTMLEKVVADVAEDLRIRQEASPAKRYKNGLDLAAYKVHQLASHVQKSRRILNDLGLIRRVLAADTHPAAGPHEQSNGSHLLELTRLDKVMENNGVDKERRMGSIHPAISSK